MQRLMWVMRLRAIYRQPRISRPTPGQRVYPYLLRDVRTTQPNQSLPPRRRGCGRRTSPTCLWPGDSCTWWRSWIGTAGTWWPGGCPTPPDRGRGQALEAGFCAEALTEALGRGRPEVFNTDQGSQFTSREFTQLLEDSGVKISMDGKGHYSDNIFVERLWRTVKYEEVYLKAYASATEARNGLRGYFRFYNDRRPHQALSIGRRQRSSMESLRS